MPVSTETLVGVGLALASSLVAIAVAIPLVRSYVRRQVRQRIDEDSTQGLRSFREAVDREYESSLDSFRGDLGSHHASEIEVYRGDLKAQQDAEIELFKAVWAMRREHEVNGTNGNGHATNGHVRFLHLEDQRAHITHALYERLTTFEETLGYSLMPTLTVEDRNAALARARAAGEDFERYFRVNRPFFPKWLCGRIDRLARQLHAAEFESIDYRQWAAIDDNPTARQALQHDLPAVREALETEFRTLLGFSEEDR